MNNRKLFKIADIFIASFVLLAAILFVFCGKGCSSGNDLIAQIRIDSQLYKEIDLSAVSEPYTMTLTGKLKATLYIEKGAISFESSECPDKICVHTGKLTQSGDAAVCLPAHISVTLTEKLENIDGVTG